MNTSKPANASKWMRTALLAALAAIVAAGCNNDEIEAASNTPSKQGRKTTIHVATGERTADTRVAYDDNKVGTADGNALTWQAGDQLTVVRMDYDRYRNHKSDYLYQGKDGDTSGNFEGTEITDWGNSWTVYYPHTVEIDTKDGTATLPMTGQIQAADGSTAHLRNYMLLAATDLTNLDDGFSLEMKSSIMKFDLKSVPAEVGELKELMWMAESATGTRSIKLSFEPGAVNFGAGTGTLTAYLSFMPEEMTVKQGGKFTVILTGDKVYRAVTTVVDGKRYEAGKRYTAEIEQSGINWQEIDIMALTVKVDESSLGFNIPFPPGTYLPNRPIVDNTPANITVNWGDGSEVTAKKGKTLSDFDEFNHTYPAAGTYTVYIISDQPDETQKQIPDFNFFLNRNNNNNSAKLISINTPLLNTGETIFIYCFGQCTGLQSIPKGLFDKNTKVTDFSTCFALCTDLQSIPQGLFDKNTEVTDFSACFGGCTALQSIPQGLFDKNTEVTDFSECFMESGLQSIPEGLFNYNTKVTRFTSCFQDCTQLVLHKKIFSTTENRNRFAGKTMVFTDCFSSAGSSLIMGSTSIAPDLWNYSTGGETWSTSGCFEGTNNLNNWNDIPTDWGGPKTTN